MAKGLEKFQERNQQLQLLGKDLARRAKSRCELCGSSGVSLNIYEVAPVPKVPDLDSCLLICSACLNGLNHLDRSDINHWRSLSETLWSDIPAAQVMAARILIAIQNRSDWAETMLEQAMMDDSLTDWIAKHPLT